MDKDSPSVDSPGQHGGSHDSPGPIYSEPIPRKIRKKGSSVIDFTLKQSPDVEPKNRSPLSSTRDQLITTLRADSEESHDSENELEPEMVQVTLLMMESGLGFTITGGVDTGEATHISAITPGGIADWDGRLQVGDVLVRINRISLKKYTQMMVMDLIQSLPLESYVDMEVRRDLNSQQLNRQVVSSPEAVHQEELERLTVHVVKGSQGFGFFVGECDAGHVVNQILDGDRCSKLQVGDILLEVDQVKVRSYSHSQMCSILKRYARGDKVAFLVHRKSQKTQLSSSLEGNMPSRTRLISKTEDDGEKFVTKEVRLVKQRSEFGFRIVGGAEVDVKPTVKEIVKDGAADGVLEIGDEIRRINGKFVTDAYHLEVIALMKKAAAQGEVLLDIRRRMSSSEPSPQDWTDGTESPLTSVKTPKSPKTPSSNPSTPEGSRTPVTSTSSPTTPKPPRTPVKTKSVPTSSIASSENIPAPVTPRTDSAPATPRTDSAPATPQSPRTPLPGIGDVILERPNSQSSFGFAFQPKNSSRGGIITYIHPDSPACNELFLNDELVMVNNENVSELKISDILAHVKKSNTTIYLTVYRQTEPNKTDDSALQESPSISSDSKEIQNISIERVGRSFGFTIRGGEEYNCPISILKIAEGGAAHIDERLKVGDELLEINGNSTAHMLHTKAIMLIKEGGPRISLVLQREPPDELGWDSARLYSEAMKAGFVSVKTTNVLLFGMAGTGKTSTKHLIFGLPPPKERNSTPLAEAAERVLIRKIRDLSGIKATVSDGSWKPVTIADLKQLVADIIQYCGRTATKSVQISEELATKVKQLPVTLSEPQLHSKNTVSTRDKAKPKFRSLGDIISSTNEPSKVGGKNSAFLDHVSDVITKIQSMVAMEPHCKEIMGSNWIYFIDSGGQPHFYNLLPLFIQGISAALYVLRLSDRLDDHPLVEFYRNDRPIDKPFRSHLSTEENFKYLVQSIQSCNVDCRLVCIGTHLDKIDDCSETIEEKNKKLFEVLPENIRDRCHFDSIREEHLLIPINSQVLGKARKDTADKIRSVIQQCPSKEIQVPVWWYALEIIIEEVSNEQGCNVMSLDQCRIIANKLSFHEDALVEALKFFHKHHIFHYYPNILPNIVFCDTQVLLDKVTELVEHAAFLRDGSSTAAGLGFKYQFRDRGTITLECLKEFRKHYVHGLFGPAELIEVFKHLLILTPLNSSSDKIEYFMPSLLGISSADDVNALRASLLKEMKLTPLLVQFKNGWPHFGVFCCLQVFLIKDCGWSLPRHSSSNKPKQNITRLCLPNQPGSVTLIDSLTYIEVYADSNTLDQIYAEVRRNILSGIQYACRALKYDKEESELAFLCPHSVAVDSTTKHSHHPAAVLASSGWMRCTKSEKCYPLESCHKMWLSDLDSVVASARHNEQWQIEKAYDTMVKYSVELVSAMSKDPVSLAAALFGVGLISQATLDETFELNETKKAKGSRLYQVVLNAVETFPVKFADFVGILNNDKVQYGDVLTKLDRLFIVETML